MKNQGFDNAVTSFRDGRIDASEFFRATHSIWQRMARYLLRRWSHPSWVDEDEIVQELRCGASISVWCYSEHRSRGRSLAEFVEWNAVDYAKKKLHKMRSAKLSGNADSNPSRYDSISRYADLACDHTFAVEPAQHVLLELKEAIDHVCESEPQRLAIEAFLHAGSITQGASLLFDDERLRKACGLTRPKDAGRLVATTALALARELNAAA